MIAGSKWRLVPVILALMMLSGASRAAEDSSVVADVCARLEAAAGSHDIAAPFFARLIWVESRFDPNAVSPKGAQGIAQFMPATARMRGLTDPFDVPDAITASARYLAELRDEFGNLGLAAAAYNAGRDRVRAWQKGSSSLPYETENYVLSITGATADAWTANGVRPAIAPLDGENGFQAACRALPARWSAQRVFAKWQPWGVHVAANFSRRKALRTYRRLQREFSGVLAGRRPMLVREVNYSMGHQPMNNIRLGAKSRAEADALCEKLKRAGGNCVVIKNARRR
jgi:hypothetical protein